MAAELASKRPLIQRSYGVCHWTLIQPWSVPPGGTTGDGKPGSWGGHAIPVVAYDTRGVTVVTWGALQAMTWSFWEAYCDEAYAILSDDYMDGQKKAPQGFNLQQLQADLADLK